MATSAFFLLTLTQVARATVRVTFSTAPLLASATGANDGLNPLNYAVKGSTPVIIQSVRRVASDANSVDLFLAAPLTSGNWQVVVANVISGPPATALSVPTSLSFTASAVPEKLTSGGSNDTSADILRKHLSQALRGPNWDALIAALAVGDDYNTKNAQKIFRQQWKSSAVGVYLDRRMGDDGFRRPANIGMSDDVFRSLGIKVTTEKITDHALWNVLESYYGAEAVRANLTSSLPQPYNIVPGDSIMVRVDERVTATVTFATNDFTNAPTATAVEVAAAMNRQFISQKLHCYAVAFLNPNDNQTYVRIYSGTLGMAGAIRIVGGKSQNHLFFPTCTYMAGATTVIDPLNPFLLPGFMPPLGSGALGGVPVSSTQWTLLYTAGTNTLRFTFTGGADPTIDLVQVGDYVNVYGTIFNAANRGSFSITNIYVDNATAPRTIWFEVLNPLGVSETVSTTNSEDLIIFRPVRSASVTALVTSANSSEIDFLLPATSEAVNRQAGSAAYLHSQPALTIGSLNRDTTGLATVVTTAVHGLQTGNVVMIDGAYSTSANLDSNGWALGTASMTFAREHHEAVTLADGRVLVCGGLDAAGLALNRVEVFDPARNAWATLPNMNVARYDHRAILMNDGRVMVTGGLTYNAIAVNSAEIFDPKTSTWTATGTLSAARSAHVIALLTNSKILVAGGTTTLTFDLYDPGTGLWTNAATPIAFQSFARATVLPSGRVLLSGGGTGTTPTTTAYLYKPDTNTWVASAGTVPVATMQHTATLLPNGKVLIAGGRNGAGALANCSLYNYLTDSFAVTGALAVARYVHSGGISVTGKALVAGGLISTGTSATATTEVFDSTLGTWTTVLALNAARAWHRHATLPNGKIIFFGGSTPTPTVLSSLETFPREVSGGGLNGTFSVTVVNATTFTFSTPDFPFLTQAFTGTVTPVSAPAGGLALGPFIFDPVHGLSLTSKFSTVTAALPISQTAAALTVGDATQFPDAAGWLLIGFGTAYQQVPLQYFGRLSSTQLLIDSNFVFSAAIPVGADVTLLLQKATWLPTNIESVGAFYLTASPAGRTAASSTLKDILAAGFTSVQTVVYPGDRGLGGEGFPTSGGKLSDVVSVWAGDDVDGEVLAARGY